MPQAAWEALLRDTVQGLRPPYTPQTLRRWLQATRAQRLGHRRPTGPPPTPPPPQREGRGHGQGEGKRQKGTLRQGRKEGRKVTGRRP